MDCCGMSMAVREGGGVMCRRCGSVAGVPVARPVNLFANWVTEAGSEPVVAVLDAPVVGTGGGGGGIESPLLVSGSLEQTAENVEAALDAAGVPRGTNRGFRGRRGFGK